MRARRLAVTMATVCVLAGAVGATDVVTARFNDERTGFTPDKVSPPLGLLWKFSTQEDSSIAAAPLIVGERVFFCAVGTVYCLDAATGQSVWQYETKIPLRATPLYHNGRLYVGNDRGELHIVDAADTPTDARVLAVLDFKQSLRSTPVIIGDTLYQITQSGRLFGVDLATLKAEELVRFQNGPYGEVVCHNGQLYFTGVDSITYCFDATRNRKQWGRGQGQLVRAPIYADDFLFLGTKDGFRAIRLRTGRAQWSLNGVVAARGSASYANGKLYVTTLDEKLAVLDPKDKGKILGAVELDSPTDGLVTIADRDVYVGTSAGNINVLNADTMAVTWVYRCSPVDTVGPKEEIKAWGIHVPVVVGNGYVLALNDGGTLFCLRADAIVVGKPRLYKPQLVTNAHDNSLVTFDLYDDELRAAMEEQANAAAPAGSDPVIPEEAKQLQLPGKQPTFKFETYVYDEGSGVDMYRMKVDWDGQPFDGTMNITPNDHLLTVNLLKGAGGLQRDKLNDGDHTITLHVPDYKGNLLDRSFTFTIDNTLPPVEPVEKPETTPGGPGMPGMEGQPGSMAPPA